MRCIPLPAVFILVALTGAVPVRAAEPALPLQYIEVVGQVMGKEGPIPGAKVSLEGVGGVMAISDESGSYSLAVPIGALGDPARRTVEARVSAEYPGWSFTLRNGQSSFAIDLRMETRSDPPRCRVRSNLLRPVDDIAGAIQRGKRTALVPGIDFIGEEWGRAFSNRLSLRSEAITTVGAPTEPRLPEWRAGNGDVPAESARGHAATATSGGPGASPDSDTPLSPPAAAELVRTEKRAGPRVRETTAPADPAPASARAQRQRVRRVEPDTPRIPAALVPDSSVITFPGPGVALTDASLIRRVETEHAAIDVPAGSRSMDEVLAGEGDCACRIRGTIEIHPDHLLTRRLELIVSLSGVPGVRDTVQLFMGSPRPFELPALKCGTWRLEVDAVARRDFVIESEDGRAPVDCARGGLRQLRIVLSPR